MTTAAQAAQRMLRALGTAYRSDWSEFDGRTLQMQLDEIVAVLDMPRMDEPGRLDRLVAHWYINTDICPTCHVFERHCRCGP